MTDEIPDLPGVDPREEPLKPDYKRFSNLMKASFIAILVDSGLILFKTFLAGLSGNAVLLADALHSGGDLAVSITVLISIIVHHSFHDSPRAKRVEAFAAFVISIGLIAGSIRMLRDVLMNQANDYSFITKADIPLVITLAGISVILGITLAVALYKQKVGRENDSIAFKAEGLHTYSDFLTSLGVWITLFVGYFGAQIGRIMSFIIALAVFQIGLRILISSFRSFQFGFKLSPRLSILISPNLKNRIKETIRSISDFLGRIDRSFLTIRQFPARLVIGHKEKVVGINIVLILMLYIGTGFYQVLPYQTGLELFLGKVSETNPPGLHFHPPRPLGSVVLVDTEVSIRLESGFRTDINFSGEEPPVYLWEYTHKKGRYNKVIEEALAISGDENLVDVNFLCYYRITDAMQYALENRNAHETLRSILVQKARTVLSHYQLDKLLAEDRATVQNELLNEMKRVTANMPLGVTIQRVYMQEAHPPIEVIPQYRAVGSAREKKDHIIHQARAYVNDLIPRTKGKASTIALNAVAEAAAEEYKAVGETKQFSLSQESFNRNVAIHKIRLWWEMVENVMKDKQIYILPHTAKRRIVLTES